MAIAENFRAYGNGGVVFAFVLLVTTLEGIEHARDYARRVWRAL